MNYKKINNISGWAVFAVAAYTYLSTIEPTASFWDCGEYIATAFKLQVGHPPGAPLFQMIGRFFTLFAGSDVTKAAKMVNIMSGLCSAFTILFLFWSITALARKIAERGGEVTDGKMLAIMGSGAVGALAYAFSDSFWFSAVEGEVYAMSAMFTAMVFWAILKWERVADEPHSERWIIFIAYMFGLSIGVHLLNLLVIPAIVFIYYFKNFEVNNKGFAIAGILSVLLLGGIQAEVIPGIVNLAGNFELFFINTIHLPYNSGTIVYFLLLVSIIVVGLMYTHNESEKFFNYFMILSVVFFVISLIASTSGSAGAFRFIVGGAALALLYVARKRVAMLNTILLSFTVLVIGYSSFVMLVIRSNANTPMNENAPQDAISLLSYLNREQYGDWPILYGQYYNSPLDPQTPYKDGTPVYIRTPKAPANAVKLPAEGNSSSSAAKEQPKYIISDDRQGSIPNYDPDYCTIFPRMWSSQSSHEGAYRNWGGIKKDKTTDAEGHEKPVKPAFSENLTYFVSYQINWMFWRYFLWNYVGRQNDVQGHGNATDGNWITGFKSFDDWRLGSKGTLESNKNNKARNAFYALPLILGIVGMFFHFNRHNKDAFVVLLLFLFTGLAIIVFLNQYPYQPRERDYAYAGACYAFAMWIGIGVLAIFDWISKKVPQKAGAVLATAVCLVAVPGIMAKDGWDDHDRSKRFTARDFAKDYLDSCAPNAILFTNGDNDTFPLWYVQEVEGYRTDVRVCNLSLLNTDWYINQMKRKAYDSDPVPLSLTEDKYRQGTRDYVPFYDRKIAGYISVRELIDFVGSEDPQNKLQTQNGKDISYFPTKKMSITVDSLKVLKNGTVQPELANRIVKSINWDLDKSYVLKNDLMVLDLLATNNWERPIYFAVTTGPESYLNLQDYFQLEGLAYRLVPVKVQPQEQQISGTRVATDIMYNNIMKFSWGGMDTKGAYLDENIQRMCTNLRIQLGTLATTLIAEGKKDKAMKVVDKCLQVMPHENVPFDATIYQLVLTYYQLNANDKANALAKQLFNIFESDMNYYISLGGTGAITYGREIRQAQEIMSRLVYMAKTNKQDAIAKDFEARYNVFARIIGNPNQQPQPQQEPALEQP
jgi:tetratricopeptide (TPR) repeat protein